MGGTWDYRWEGVPIVGIPSYRWELCTDGRENGWEGVLEGGSIGGRMYRWSRWEGVPVGGSTGAVQ